MAEEPNSSSPTATLRTEPMPRTIPLMPEVIDR
ncbi:hypothetical protein HUW46_08387 [Amycolatopsis sp. CA-230715]|nr:hypothetical protein HUW46_08387 [Amycolatopsis sp. CA-230715]